MSIYLVITEGYEDPMPVVGGPFASRNDALEGYRTMIIEGGAEISPEEKTEDLYLNDDAIAMAEVP